MSTSPTIRPLKSEHLAAFNVVTYGRSVRGLAVELDGDVVGVAGVVHGAAPFAFSEMDDSLRSYPKTILRAARQFRDVLAHYSHVTAVASETEPNSPAFLEWVGFKYSHNDGAERVFTWHP